jgi:hypothetical protein
MTNLTKTGLIAWLSLSALLTACNDDDDNNGGDKQDAGSAHDAGTITDASSSLDATTSLDGSMFGDASQQADAGAKQYVVSLTGAQETPACGGLAGPNAAGTATVTVAADRRSIQLNVSYSGLAGSVNNGHIHYGAAGTSGPVVLPLGGPFESPIMRVLTAANYAPAGGAPADFDGFITDLEAGKTYLNLHTVACANGEIRGQIR